MRKWKTALVLTAIIAAILCVVILPAGDNEPKYQRRPLRYWLLESQEFSNDGSATNALISIGTNALPFLIEWIRHEPSPVRLKFANAIPPDFDGLVRPLVRTERDQLADMSPFGFRYIGANATGAIPELTRLVYATNAPRTAIRAMRALSFIGTNGLPALITAAQDRNYPLRLYAVAAMAFMPIDCRGADITTPVLIGLLNDRTHPQIAPVAATGLGRNTNAPALSVPALMSCFTSPTAPDHLRIAAVQSLAAFGGQAANALPALSNAALTDLNSAIRSEATNAIRRISGMSTQPPRQD